MKKRRLGILLAGQNGNSRSLRNTDGNNFGPRVGIAYQANSNTVVRTGFGISYTEEFDGGTQLYSRSSLLATPQTSFSQVGYFNVDAGIHRDFKINEEWKAVFRWEMFNAFNHANFSNPNASVGNPLYGQITATLPSRSQQVALKLTF